MYLTNNTKASCASKCLAVVAVAASLMGGYDLARAAGAPSTEAVIQQQVKVSGSVVDVQGQPVPGASVIQKGSTTNGTITGAMGEFSITVPAGSTLVVSCIGFAETEVAAAAQVNIVLKEDNEFLSEAVVTALGITRERKSLGYALEEVKAEELMKNKTANPINSLSGKIAGVNVTQSSDAAGSGAQIILRGR
ncbi:MAG: carboxypeptidase-like regulatory domain-containing protein [Bacteroidales bacterium]|nr:carboxypeptidase-like regulatory domain-containing protein [Bacteroidales bacterium]